jgi:ATP-binding cassette subfamily B multidrug efflux pump
MSEITQKLLDHPILFYIKSHKRAFTIGLFFLLVTNFLDAMTPLVLKAGIDALSNKAPLSQIQKLALLLFAVMLSLSWTRYGWRIYWGKFHTYASEDLRNRIFRHLTQMGMRFFNKSPVGELMSLITNDVNSFRQGLGPGLLILIDGISITLIIIPTMLTLNAGWTFKTMFFIPFVPLFIWKVMALIHDAYKIQQDRLSEMTGFSQEIVGGIRVIKSFAQEFQKTRQFNEFSHRYEDASNHLAWVDTFYFLVTQTAIISGTVCLFWVGTPDVLKGVATIGTFVAFQNYIARMVWPLSALGLGVSQIQKAMASFTRIKELLKQQTDTPDSGKLQLEKFEKLEIKNLQFGYSPEHQVLKNINLSIQQGEFVGITGPVGSGKTTLLSLITRLYPFEQGEILINDKNLNEYTLESLRKNFVLIPQDPFLFSMSVQDNISYGNGSQKEDEHQMTQLKKVAHSVDLDQEIDSFPAGFKAPLGERGLNLSGGQKQRLTLARGTFLDSEVTMFDDNLSAVDHRTEQTILKRLGFKGDPNDTSIAKESQGINLKTCIMVTHRLSPIEKADKIIVLKEGQIEAFGTHQELLLTSPTYRTMASIQGYSL